jgi:hypothetical protein
MYTCQGVEHNFSISKLFDCTITDSITPRAKTIYTDDNQVLDSNQIRIAEEDVEGKEDNMSEDEIEDQTIQNVGNVRGDQSRKCRMSRATPKKKATSWILVSQVVLKRS